MFGLSNPWVTPESSSLMIYVSLRAVLAVESMRHPGQDFVGDIGVPRGCVGSRIPASPVKAVR